jgi:hypothetical protein
MTDSNKPAATTAAVAANRDLGNHRARSNSPGCRLAKLVVTTLR